MKNEYFKMIGQKSGNGKMILVAVVDEHMIGENIPDIFEVQACKMASTIYTGTYPQIKINSGTVKDRTEDLKGLGVDGILLEEMWYYKSIYSEDVLGISLPNKKY